MAPSTSNHKRADTYEDGSDGLEDPQTEQADGASIVGDDGVDEPDESADKVLGKEKPRFKAEDENSKHVLKDAAVAETGSGNHRIWETKTIKPPLWLRDAHRAIYRGEFVWKTKPNPYDGDLIGKDEEQTDCEQRIRKELESAWHTASRHLIEQGEVETADFEWRDHQIHWEKFLKINWNDESPFEDSTIAFRHRVAKDAAIANEIEASTKARQMALAIHYQKLHESSKTNKKSKAIYQTDKPGRRNHQRLVEPKSNIRQSDEALYHGKNDDEIRHKWSELEDQYNTIMDSKRKPKTQKYDVVYSTEELLVKITECWTGWGKLSTADSVHNNKGDRITAGDPNVLRPTPKESIVILVDKNEKLIALLIPEAIQDAFSPEVRDRMLTDAKHFYTHIKYANSSRNKRHISELSHSSRRYGPPGSDHYGIWHEGGQTHEPVRETSDSSECVPFVKQCLSHLLEVTGGTMTKMLDFWFGVWEPDLREEYRETYRGLPRYARLPLTHEDRDEIYTLRVTIVNRYTNHHHDQKDWGGGLTGLVQLGDFEGGEMCLHELGIRLDGYGDGAMLLFRGIELHHYVAPWNWDEGGYRYAFDHTTHESIRQVVLKKKSYPNYVEPKFPEDDPDYEPDPNKIDDASNNDDQKGRTKKASTAKKPSANKAAEKKAPAKKAKGKGKATADTNNELGDEPASDAKLDDDEVIDPPHKITAPKKRPANEIFDDEDSEPLISMNKRRETTRTNKKDITTASKKRPGIEKSNDEDSESPRPTTKRPGTARTNKKDNASKERLPKLVTRSKRTR